VRNTEALLQLSDSATVARALLRLDERCSDYGKKLCLAFDLNSNPAAASLVTEMLQAVRNTSIVLELDPKDFSQHAQEIRKIASVQLEKKSDLMIHNKAIWPAPYIVGRAGPYTLHPAEWQCYEKTHPLPAIVCGQSTMMFDVEQLMKENREADLPAFITKAADALLLTNSMMRSHSSELFEPLIRLNPEHAADFFMLSRNVIRLWNYGWKAPAQDSDVVLQKLAGCKNVLDRFCPAEETIYKSCGMPMRFRVALSCCFETFVKDTFTPASFKKFTFRNMQQLYESGEHKILAAKETLFSVFDGGDIISFYREGNPSVEDALRELCFIISSYRFPLFRYSFATTRSTDLKLTDFE
jgi:hypothetical protein